MKPYTTQAQRENHWDQFRDKLREKAGEPKAPSTRQRKPPRINY